MPSWQDYKTQARSRGALALELYMVHSIPGTDMDKVRAALPAHLAYQKSLETQGQLVLAGPLSDDTGEMMEGAGLIIYRAPNFTSARQMAQDDPMHQQAARTFTLRRWLVNEGSISLSVNLSEQKLIAGI